MQLELFNAIKTQLETISSLKYVGLWNNQFVNENQTVSHDFPNAYIEFNNIEYQDLQGGVQSYNMDIVIHLGFKTAKTEDTAVFTLKQLIYGALGSFSSATAALNTKLSRSSEIVDYNHNNVQDYQLIFTSKGKDYGVTTMPTELVANPVFDITVTPVITNTVIRTADKIT
jgi:hypothetical protein